MLSPALPARPLVLLALFPLLTTCSGARPPQDGETGAACAEDIDCRSGYCLTDPSFPDNYCSQDCEAEEICDEGASCENYLGYMLCLDSCESDDECREGYLCQYGTCRPPCGSDRACRPPDTCSGDGRCRPPCEVDGECPPKHRCEKGKCIFYCEQDGDCPRPNHCQDGKCVPPCGSAEDCLPGYDCNPASGRCEEKPGKKLGEPCATSAECATGHCLPTRKICSVKCAASSRCPSGWVCGLEAFDSDNNGRLDQAEADCLPKKGPGGPGALCGGDAECASSHCYDGFCMEACAVDADCGQNQCVGVSVILEGGTPAYKGCLPRQGVGSYTLGSFAGSGSIHAVDIPPNAQSFVLSAEVSSTTAMPFFAQLKDPTGAVLNDAQDVCSIFSAPIRFLPAEQQISLFVPNTPAVTLRPGRYVFGVAASQASLPVTVKLLLKLGRAEKGTLNVNWFFLDLSPTTGFCVPGVRLSAASAPTHPWFTKIRNNMAAIFKMAGISLGKESFHDLVNPALDAISLSLQGISPELQQLFASSKGMQGSAVNVFIVRKIEVQGMAGIILGIAGGIPGPLGMHGLVHSGVALSAETACFEPYGVSSGHVLAHEIGHFLGLFHNIEAEDQPGLQNGTVVCPCPCGPNMSCQTGIGGSWCRGLDPIPDTDKGSQNLMYFSADSSQTFQGSSLSPGQIRVLLDNPLVGH